MINIKNYIQTKIDIFLSEEFKKKLYIIIFESDTKAGKAFDVALIIFIILNVLLVIANSVGYLHSIISPYYEILEIIFTLFFTAEYILRIYCSPKPSKYIFSFFGIVDFLATIPLYLSFIFSSAQYLFIIRTFRLIRIFRVFKLFSFLKEGKSLLNIIKFSIPRIVVFFLFVLIMVISIGTIMYMIEGEIPNSGFKDIPTSIYWAIVTLTTVGYGDITPVTVAGRFFSAIVMLLGYTIIAVPTGIISASVMRESTRNEDKKQIECNHQGNDADAMFCKHCGAKLK